MINYVHSLTLRVKGGVMKLLFKMFISQGQSGSSVCLVQHVGVSLGHISSRSLEVGFLTWVDWQMAGAAPVCFSVPPVDGIYGHDGTAGDLCGVFCG